MPIWSASLTAPEVGLVSAKPELLDRRVQARLLRQTLAGLAMTL